MRVNAERLWDLHQQMAKLTDPQVPYTRRSFTPLYRQSRDLLKQLFEDLEMSVKIDAAGNMIGVYPGSGNQNITVGSHTDTVPAGGRFDGISGVLSLIEAIRCIKESGISLKKNIVGIDFLAEEPSEFGLSCIGSRLATGNFTPEMLELRHVVTNTQLKDAIDEWGGDSSALSPGHTLFDKSYFDAFLELHIEQGPVLEKEQLDVGLVTGICSVTRYNFKVLGKADHAGNTPMDVRSDAIAAATKLIDFIYQTAETTLLQQKYFTATVGKIDVFPNGSNVIAEKVEFSLDIRSEDNELVQEKLAEIFAQVNLIEAHTRTIIEKVLISQSKPAISDESILNQLEKSASELNLKYKRLLSGAGHDAAYLSKIMPMAMIFIPCKDGRSHCPVEYSSQEQLEKGANLLLNTLVSLSS